MGKISARVYVDEEVWRRFRAKAVLSGKTLTEYLNEVIRKEVAE